MIVLTDEQLNWYSMYTTVGEKSYKRLKEIEEILDNDWADVHNLINLLDERDALRKKIRYISEKRREVETARMIYEDHLEEARKLKEKWGF